VTSSISIIKKEFLTKHTSERKIQHPTSYPTPPNYSLSSIAGVNCNLQTIMISMQFNLEAMIMLLFLMVKRNPCIAFAIRTAKPIHLTRLSAKQLNKPGKIDLPVIPVIGPIFNSKPLMVRTGKNISFRGHPVELYSFGFILPYLQTWSSL
jgi:hypothetical protein